MKLVLESMCAEPGFRPEGVYAPEPRGEMPREGEAIEIVVAPDVAAYQATVRKVSRERCGVAWVFVQFDDGSWSELRVQAEGAAP